MVVGSVADLVPDHTDDRLGTVAVACSGLAARHPMVRRLVAQLLVGATRPLRPALIRRYLSGAASPKLVLGAGHHRRSDWLSSDLLPLRPSTIFLDATKPFPMPSGTFDFVLCEHMIEHLDRRGADAMLRECRRVLSDNGVLRLATPDLDRFLTLTKRPLDPRETRYVRWANVEGEAPDAELDNPVYTLNRMMRSWGHTFLYDERTLTGVLERSGFAHVSRHRPGSGSVAALCDLERHGTMIGEDFNLFETMVLEARPRG